MSKQDKPQKGLVTRLAKLFSQKSQPPRKVGKNEKLSTAYYGDVLDDSGSIMCEGGAPPLDQKTNERLEKYRSEARAANSRLRTQPVPQPGSPEVVQPRKPASLPASPRMAGCGSEIQYEAEDDEGDAYTRELGIKEISPPEDKAARLRAPHYSPLSTMSSLGLAAQQRRGGLAEQDTGDAILQSHNFLLFTDSMASSEVYQAVEDQRQGRGYGQSPVGPVEPDHAGRWNRKEREEGIPPPQNNMAATDFLATHSSFGHGIETGHTDIVSAVSRKRTSSLLGTGSSASHESAASGRMAIRSPSKQQRLHSDFPTRLHRKAADRPEDAEPSRTVVHATSHGRPHQFGDQALQDNAVARPEEGGKRHTQLHTTASIVPPPPSTNAASQPFLTLNFGQHRRSRSGDGGPWQRGSSDGSQSRFDRRHQRDQDKAKGESANTRKPWDATTSIPTVPYSSQALLPGDRVGQRRVSDTQPSLQTQGAPAGVLAEREIGSRPRSAGLRTVPASRVSAAQTAAHPAKLPRKGGSQGTDADSESPSEARSAAAGKGRAGRRVHFTPEKNAGKGAAKQRTKVVVHVSPAAKSRIRKHSKDGNRRTSAWTDENAEELLEESLALSASLAQDQQLAAEPPSVLSPSRFLQLASQPTEERYSTAHSGPPAAWGDQVNQQMEFAKSLSGRQKLPRDLSKATNRKLQCVSNGPLPQIGVDTAPSAPQHSRQPAPENKSRLEEAGASNQPQPERNPHVGGARPFGQPVHTTNTRADTAVPSCQLLPGRNPPTSQPEPEMDTQAAGAGPSGDAGRPRFAVSCVLDPKRGAAGQEGGKEAQAGGNEGKAGAAKYQASHSSTLTLIKEAKDKLRPVNQSYPAPGGRDPRVSSFVAARHSLLISQAQETRPVLTGSKTGPMWSSAASKQDWEQSTMTSFQEGNTAHSPPQSPSSYAPSVHGHALSHITYSPTRSCSSRQSRGPADEQWAPEMDAVKEASEEEDLASKTMAEMSALSFRPGLGQEFTTSSQLTQATLQSRAVLDTVACDVDLALLSSIWPEGHTPSSRCDYAPDSGRLSTLRYHLDAESIYPSISQNAEQQKRNRLYSTPVENMFPRYVSTGASRWHN